MTPESTNVEEGQDMAAGPGQDTVAGPDQEVVAGQNPEVDPGLPHSPNTAKANMV